MQAIRDMIPLASFEQVVIIPLMLSIRVFTAAKVLSCEISTSKRSDSFFDRRSQRNNAAKLYIEAARAETAMLSSVNWYISEQTAAEKLISPHHENALLL